MKIKLSVLALVLLATAGAHADDFPFSAAHSVTKGIKEEFHKFVPADTNSYAWNECRLAIDGMETGTQVDTPENRSFTKSFLKQFYDACPSVIDNKTFAGYAQALDKVLPHD